MPPDTAEHITTAYGYWPSLAVFLVTYFFIATEKIDKTAATIIGAGVLITTRQVGYMEAVAKIDLNVIFLLVGMMLVVNILASTGLFEWIAIVTAQKAKGNGRLLVVLMLLVTAVLSAFLDNVTTIIIIAPVTILICQLLEIPVVPLLILEALFSNIGGTGTLIGDPPNIIIGSNSHLSFVDFLLHLGPIALLILAVCLVVVTLLMGKRFEVSARAKERLVQADPSKAIIETNRLLMAIPVLFMIFLGFFLSHSLHIDTGIIALAGGFFMCLVCRIDVHHALAKIEWTTILFFVGLFMLVGALEENGLFAQLGTRVMDLTGGNLLLTAIAVLWFSAIFSAFLDNIPLVISMIPIIEAIIPEFALARGLDPAAHETLVQIGEPLYWSLALGACLGGNGTLVGASANVVISQIARRNHYDLSFGHFMRLGFPVMLLSATLATVYIYLRYFVL